jgi:hypothetical protein
VHQSIRACRLANTGNVSGGLSQDRSDHWFPLAIYRKTTPLRSDIFKGAGEVQ